MKTNVVTFICYLYMVLVYVQATPDEIFRPIFRTNYCEMKCNGQPHTLCESKEKPLIKTCTSKSKISAKARQDMIKQLIYAHNGVRDRIARIMRVANMVEVVWNNELADMATKWLRECRPYETDPCTQLYLPTVNRSENDKDEKLDSYCYVAQNRYFDKNFHYPTTLIENALRTWYHQKDNLEEPTLRSDGRYETGSIEGENNFTHLALPELKYFGCDFDKIFDGFLIICNYHPYMTQVDDNFNFMYGTPGSMCPMERPLHNSKGFFTHICIGMDTYFDVENENSTCRLVQINISILLGLFLNYYFCYY